MNGGDQVVIKNDISLAISTYLETENLELYDLNIAGNESISKVEIFIFSHEEQELSTFERLNYQIQRLLEDIGLEKGTYELILSSPGIERKLKTKRHFELSVNELVKIKLIEPILEQHQHSVTKHYLIEGYINSVGENHIIISSTTIDPFGRDYKIEISNIKNAKIEFKKFKERVKG